LYAKVRPKDIKHTSVAAVEASIRRLTIQGILKYGGQLCIVEMGSILSIYFLKLIIDHLNSPKPDALYGVYLFFVFTIGRLAAVVARGYYDLHVYNYFKFVQTQIQCWLFELACNLP